MRLSITLLTAGMVLMGWGCEKNNDPTPPTTDPGTLTVAESDHLTLMREEEKLARDLYMAFDAKWGTLPFKNISLSEQTHMDMCLEHHQLFGLIDPVEGFDVGAFPSPGMQTIYNDFHSIGMVSEIKALEQGAEVEEIDILDLEWAMANCIQNPDLMILYSNLRKASRNHLRSYYQALQQRGVTYQPRHMDIDDFNMIINSPRGN